MQAFNEMQSLEWLAVTLNLEKKNFEAELEKQQPGKEKKSRAAKKRQKLLQKQKQYQTPQARKERRRITKERVKNKQKQQIKGMTKQQANKFIEAKKQERLRLKQKMLQAQEVGLPIFIDCAYQQNMNSKQRRSLGVQIQLIYKGMRQIENPCSLHICGVGGQIQASLNKMGLINLPFGIHKQDVLEVGKKLNKQLIYLSPDAPEQLKEVSNDCAYILGGLVDRSIIKNASLNRAKQLGIKAFSLPIKQYMIKRKCLNLDHVALMLVRVQTTGNWKEAFYSYAPKRYSKLQSQEKVQVQGEESSDESEQQSGNNIVSSEGQQEMTSKDL